MTRLIRKALLGWQFRRMRKQRLRELDRRLAEYRRQHKRGSARIIKARRDVLHAAMGRSH